MDDIPEEIIVLCVRWYLRYCLSYRDLEEIVAERGVEVDHSTIARWGLPFNIFWLLSWILLTPLFMLGAYRLETPRQTDSPHGGQRDKRPG